MNVVREAIEQGAGQPLGAEDGCWGWKEQKTGVGLKKLKIGAKRGSFDLYAAPGEAVHRSQQTDYTLCDNVVTYCH